mmetsp:Transcript_24812/g.78452  ORF Transcript_24812/g.78452 Transcript_24812/m.78452 type:complete len:135 (+) Transcript_24812:175-579(+)
MNADDSYDAFMTEMWWQVAGLVLPYVDRDDLFSFVLVSQCCRHAYEDYKDAGGSCPKFLSQRTCKSCPGEKLDKTCAKCKWQVCDGHCRHCVSCVYDMCSGCFGERPSVCECCRAYLGVELEAWRTAMGYPPGE